MKDLAVSSLIDIYIELSCMITLVEHYIADSSFHGFLEVVIDSSFM